MKHKQTNEQTKQTKTQKHSNMNFESIWLDPNVQFFSTYNSIVAMYAKARSEFENTVWTTPVQLMLYTI